MRNIKHVLYPLILGVFTIACGAGCTAKGQVAYHLRRAEAYFTAGKFDEAEVEYIKVLASDHTHPQAIRRLGLINAEQGRTIGALRALSQAERRDTNDLEVRLKLGIVYLPFGAFKEAHDEAAFILDRAPTNHDAIWLLANSSMGTNLIADSRQRLQRLIQQTGDSAAAQSALGTLSLRLGNIQDAEAAFKRALALDPKCSAAHLGLGDLRITQKEPKLAGESYKTGSTLAPARSLARLSYARFMMQLGGTNAPAQMDEAATQLQEILTQVPDYMPALRMLAQLDLSMKKFDDCAAVLHKILAREPNDYEGLMLDGQLALARPTPDPARAETSFSRLTQDYARMARPFAPPYYNLAVSQLAKNESAKAVDSLSRSIAVTYNWAYSQATNGVPTNQWSRVTNTLNLILVADPVYCDSTFLLAQINAQLQKPDAAVASLTKLMQILEQSMEMVKQLPEEQRKSVNEQLLPKLARAHLFLASTYLQQNKRDQAIATYERWERLDPTDPRPHFLVGLVRRGENRAAEATKEFLDTEKLAPDDPMVTEQLVQLELSQKQFPEAMDRVQTAIKKHPEVVGLKLLLARVYQLQGNTNQAEITLRDVLKEKPDTDAAYVMLANFSLATSNYRKALSDLDAGISRNSSNVEALVLKALVLEAQKNYPGAVTAYEQALSVNSQIGVVLNNVAYLYATLDTVKDLDKALDRAQRARQVLPNDAATEDTLGWVLFNRREYPQALQLLQQSVDAFERARAAQPNMPAAIQPDVLYHLGMTHYMMLDEAQARAAFQKALEISKDFPSKADLEQRLAMLNQGATLSGTNGIAELQKRIKEVPDDGVALVRLGSLYEQTGAPAQARDAYEKALSQNPKSVNVTIRLAQLYAGPLKNPQRAMELAKTARTLTPGDPAVDYLLGRLSYQAGDVQSALGLLKASAQKLANQPDVFYDLGLVSYDVGQVAEALSAVTNALKLNPSFPRAEAARRFLNIANLCNNSSQLSQSASATQVSQALAADPELTPAIWATGLLHEQHGNLTEAKQAYEALRVKRPYFAPATRQLALLYSANPAEAAKAYEYAVKAKETYTQDPPLNKALGIALYSRGEYGRAVVALREASTQSPNDPEVFYFLGISCSQTKPLPKKETTDALNKAIALNLKSPMMERAKEVLRTVQ